MDAYVDLARAVHAASTEGVFEAIPFLDLPDAEQVFFSESLDLDTACSNSVGTAQKWLASKIGKES
jgi:hypothetical protein